MPIDIACSFINNLISLLFFNIFCFKSSITKNSLFYTYFIIITIISGYFLHYFKSSFVLIILNLGILLSFLMFYDCKPIHKILYSVILIVIMSVSELISGLFLINICNISIQHFTTNPAYIALNTILKNIFLLITILLIKICKNRIQQSSNDIPKLLLLIYPLTSIIILVTFYWSVTFELWHNKATLMVIISIFLLLISNIAIIHLLKTIIESERKNQRLDFMEKYISLTKKHQKDLAQLQKETRKIRHDLKSCLLYILGLLNSKKYNECILNIENLIGQTSLLDNIINTGYDGLDAILTSKIITANEYNVKITLILTLPTPEELVVSEFDLAMICANILDNSIEACVTYDEIKLNISYEKNISTIRIICQNPTELTEKTKRTTKADKHNHGFGLENIKDLTKKWNGMLQYDISNGVFTIIISLINA
ncbi:GHKL domain-containing protein [Acetobacterium carbinolicum]|uniref:GHKL domain-containing protein n=1 Tax=Acetobacterium carbinolicum TaxID=52690 RepID=UPI0039C90C59